MIRAVVLQGETWLTPRGGRRMSIETRGVRVRAMGVDGAWGEWVSVSSRIVDEIERLQACERALEEPIPMLLLCPWCSTKHIDDGIWATKPHRTHLCDKCGSEWRPCMRPTVGVEALTAMAAAKGGSGNA